MSIWQEHKPSSGGGDYLKLQNGDKKKVRFYSEPAVITYDGKKLRYQVVLWNRTDKLAQIYEFGPQVFGQIGELADEWGEPTSFDITIGRTGSTQFDTSYSVTPSPKSEPLTKDETDLCDMVKFPGSKSRLLSAYMEDGIMPETIQTSNSNNLSNDPGLSDEDAPLDLGDVPDEFK